MMTQEAAGNALRTRSVDERQRIVEEALARGASVAARAGKWRLSATTICALFDQAVGRKKNVRGQTEHSAVG